MSNVKYFREPVIFYKDNVLEVKNFMVNNNIPYELWTSDEDFEKEIRVYLKALGDKHYNVLKKRYPEITKEGYLIIYEY